MRVESLIYNLLPLQSLHIHTSFTILSTLIQNFRCLGKTFPYVPSNAHNSPVGIPQSIVTSTDNSPRANFIIFNAIRLTSMPNASQDPTILQRETRHSRRLVEEKFWILTGEISLNELSLALPGSEGGEGSVPRLETHRITI